MDILHRLLERLFRFPRCFIIFHRLLDKFLSFLDKFLVDTTIILFPFFISSDLPFNPSILKLVN